MLPFLKKEIVISVAIRTDTTEELGKRHLHPKS